ncbi:family 9 glycosyltransferase [Hafnia paralvei ATCC 29927]|uniref:autotransporter strand-loop-strand O-heptosyltransferase n=1 Tax=Hafnia paralvei TaxID=546367 RepID=UPI0007E4636F|nr:autotransporter strand-loop-strand O-heptosyltransferase [Hafnia paralvei]MDU1192034.1 autotransporter strand-loop-strand O-heptosyltransferase [Enterobacteriaceae bacterium]MDU1243937.1 autotransporter strand-loop-strand O-heptosyltransferase [Enterobacteriaceae bacterium]OAT43621.1 family 9 glycosyltransferase [Hafnia paralvei ATCC 29927]HCU14489.1 autotransporter strand-loop-strand O-heptosyltransferase [Hafnia paralvei]
MSGNFATPPEFPTCAGPEGILFDFNYGARVYLPEGKWHVILLDDDSGNVLFSCDSDGGWVASTKKYYVRFRIQVFHQGETHPVLDETLDMKDKPVVIFFPTGTLGDMLGWFHYAERFRQLHRCHLECVMGQEIIDLLSAQYPEITFSTKASLRTVNPYASWHVGLFFKGDTLHQPVDFRKVGFHRNAGYILGVDPRECPPRLKLDAERKIAEPYVCIAAQSTNQAKYWNNGHGWAEVVVHLKSLGYRVLCIDRQARHGQGFVWNHIPYGAEDFTGDIPLQERVDLLRHASFFIGLGSGLSWLAWAAGIPVVLISGFSLPNSEFHTPWRVFSSHGCNGCWDDTSVDFDHQDFLWCPHHRDTPRQYECTRLITGRQVTGVVDRLHAGLVDN